MSPNSILICVACFFLYSRIKSLLPVKSAPRYRRDVDEEMRVGKLQRSKCLEVVTILGFRLENGPDDSIKYVEGIVPSVTADTNYEMRLYGRFFKAQMEITFTAKNDSYSSECEFPATSAFPVMESEFSADTAKLKFQLPEMDERQEVFYICARGDKKARFLHQGNEFYMMIMSHSVMLPTWAVYVIIVVCMSISFLLSGLNIGLMSMDTVELKILANAGNGKENKYAGTIYEVRKRGNFLLCSILIANVLVNSMFTVLLDSLTTGTLAIIVSTLVVTFMGEIFPQAICARFGLVIGAKTIYFTKAMMVLTFPLSLPLSKALDFMLGEEVNSKYDRERLKELFTSSPVSDLDKHEFKIISGALELNRKTVKDVMTPLENVYMLDITSILDFETVSKILESGYSRIPVYQTERRNVVSVLYIKDLAFVDPDDKTELKLLCQFYQYPCTYVFEDLTLDVMFRMFKEGSKGHMAFVHHINKNDQSEAFYEIIGLITLEDVIEELIQEEIMDERDIVTDNRTRMLRNRQKTLDFSMFATIPNVTQQQEMSPQLALLAFQFLSTSLPQFQPPLMTNVILMRLLKRDDVYFHLPKDRNWRTAPSHLIYQSGVSADFFVLILEGKVQITVGRENLIFESGSFTHFGAQSLSVTLEEVIRPSTSVRSSFSVNVLEKHMSNLSADTKVFFTPDYTVKACMEIDYLRIRRQVYVAAVRASNLMQNTEEEMKIKLNDDDQNSQQSQKPGSSKD